MLYSQELKTAGTSFTFAIPEGSDKVSPFFFPSSLALIVISPHDGDGVIYSPSGVEIYFSFKANRAFQVELPYSLMLLDDLGKSKKGIIVKTTQPVNLTYYLLNAYASESSQIFPDHVIGTNYLVTGWGLWNDVSENNRNQIVVTASEDGTNVTITPKVTCIGGFNADIPVNVTLDRGETFVLKADTTALPLESSLSNSRVVSTKPVSVMVGSTCSYVPLGQQACNPIVDHILPKQIVEDTVFYVTPPSEPKHDARLVFISDTMLFYVVNSDGVLYQTTTGRLVVPFNKPDKFITSTPVICHMLSAGYENFWLSDPTLSTVLPQRAWTDTLLWVAPDLPLTFGSTTNYISVVYPTNDSDKVFINQDVIHKYPQRVQIPNSNFSAMMAALVPGTYRITSTVPVFSMMSAFADAEGYLSVTTGIAPPLPKQILRDLLIVSDSAKTCQTFTTKVSLQDPILTNEDVYQFRLNFVYDGSLMTPVTITPSPSIAAISSINNLSPDTIKLTIRSTTPLSLSGELLFVTFDLGTMAGPTGLRATSEESQLDFAYLPNRRGYGEEQLTIYESRGVQAAKLSIVLRSVVLGDTTTGQLFLETPLVDTLSELRVRARYDHDVLTVYSVKTTSTILAGWDVAINSIDNETDEYVYTHPQGRSVVKGPGLLGFLKGRTFVTDTNATEITLSGFFTSASPCPLDVNALDTTGEFVGIDNCGDEYLHAYMKTVPLSIVAIYPQPITKDFIVTISHKLPAATPIDVALIDMLGNTVWQLQKQSNSGPIQDINFSLPPTVTNGSYILTLTSQGQRVSSQVVVSR
jgi:hypothetical protein